MSPGWLEGEMAFVAPRDHEGPVTGQAQIKRNTFA